MAAPKLDSAAATAVDLARAAAEEQSWTDAVGEHLGAVAEEGERVVTHSFACHLAGYVDWRWAVTVVRASRAKFCTVNEVVLLPMVGALLAPAWVPWEDRIGGGDIVAGMLMPTPDDDPRLEPGFSTGDLPVDADPADWAQLRSTVWELGLGRERVLSRWGRDDAAVRWLEGPQGADNELSRQAPGACHSCGYFVSLRGSLGTLFGACTNKFSPSDGQVVSLDHGCGGHSDVVAVENEHPLPKPAFDTITVDEGLFD